MSANYKNLGPINAILGEVSEDAWTGKISKSSRVKNNIDLLTKINSALRAENLENFYRQCNKNARTRCIDGRPLAGSDENSNQDLGPQVPGGTPMTALARRLVGFEGTLENAKLSDDISETMAAVQKIGFMFGGHIDSASEDISNKTGCGAIDNMPAILEKITTPEFALIVKKMTMSLLGGEFNMSVFREVLGGLILIQGHRDSYFEKNSTGNYKYIDKVMDELRSKSNESDPVARLTGSHNEVALVINTVPGTTFDRDSFSASTENQIQIFGHDFWQSKELASLLYSDKKQANEFLTIRTMFAIATAMTLTDGSIDLIIRS